jgi:hypothetical protein
VRYAIRKQTYAGGQAYRYHVYHVLGDEDERSEQLRYVVEPPPFLPPSPTRPILFLAPDDRPAGCVRPTRSVEESLIGGEQHEIFIGAEATAPRAVIQVQQRLVDVILLRLPCYEIRLGQYRYIAQGNRYDYGSSFYELFRLQAGEEARPILERQAPAGETDETEEPPPPRPKAGWIERPPSGPNYIVEAEAAPLRQSPLTLAALVILLDMHLSAEFGR